MKERDRARGVAGSLAELRSIGLAVRDADAKHVKPQWTVERMTITGVDDKGFCRHGVKAVGWEQKWCFRCYLNWRARQRRSCAAGKGGATPAPASRT